jgi:hypothetical protein
VNSEEGLDIGTISVLRSLSNQPGVIKNLKIIYTIRVTGGIVEKSFGNSNLGPAFFMAI